MINSFSSALTPLKKATEPRDGVAAPVEALSVDPRLQTQGLWGILIENQRIAL